MRLRGEDTDGKSPTAAPDGSEEGEGAATESLLPFGGVAVAEGPVEELVTKPEGVEDGFAVEDAEAPWPEPGPPLTVLTLVLVGTPCTELKGLEEDASGIGESNDPFMPSMVKWAEKPSQWVPLSLGFSEVNPI
jgi:hypothetical protein